MLLVAFYRLKALLPEINEDNFKLRRFNFSAKSIFLLKLIQLNNLYYF